MDLFLHSINLIKAFWVRTHFVKESYESEYKDGKRNGQGNWMKAIISCRVILWTLICFKTGKCFFGNGNRYEGEYKEDKENGQGIWIK